MIPTPANAAPIDITVVIVSWNTRELLRDCLRSLHDGGLAGVSAEIRVVDNASADGSPSLVRAEFPTVALTENRENVGFARANNQALVGAPGRYLLLLNSDTVVPTGAVDQLIAAMDSHPEAAVCSPLLLNGDGGSPQFCWARFPNLVSELRGVLDLTQSPYPLTDYADPTRRAEMRPFAADWVGGACFLVRAGLVPQVGLLDEAFFMYSEETDWCRRFRRVGASTLLVPAVSVTHLGGQSSKRVPVATRERMYRSRARLYRLLYGPIGALLPTLVAFARYQLFRLKNRGNRPVSGSGAEALAQ